MIKCKRCGVTLTQSEARSGEFCYPCIEEMTADPEPWKAVSLAELAVDRAYEVNHGLG